MFSKLFSRRQVMNFSLKALHSPVMEREREREKGRVKKKRKKKRKLWNSQWNKTAAHSKFAVLLGTSHSLPGPDEQ